MSKELQVALGRRVRDLRKAQGFSQEGFADHIGVHRAYMGSVERGALNLTLQNLAKIAGGLKITPGTLLIEAEALPAIKTEKLKAAGPVKVEKINTAVLKKGKA